MIKKVILILCLTISALNAEIIKKIEITGNDRISFETIKVYGELEIGKDYTSDELNIVLKRLYSTEFFENIVIKLENNILKIDLKEYPSINEIIINGENSSQIKKAILEKIELQKRNSFISEKLNNDINLIKKLYSSLGYNFVNIDSRIENFSNNRINLIFDIDRKNKTYIKKINFIGNKVYRDSKLRDIIVSEEKKFWKFLSQNTFYKNSNIELDKRLLINYYKSQGYYDVQVLSNNVELSNENYTLLTYTINAGKRYKFNKFSTNVSSVIKKDIFQELEKEYLKYVGEYYSPFKVKKILDELDFIILNNDLQFIEHSVNEIIDNNNIEIKINIFEGNKEIVEKISIQGNKVTDESVVRSELLLDEGDPYNNLKLDQSIAKIKSRNIFNSVTSKLSDGSKKGLKNIDIEVEEKPTGEITAGAGIGTNGGSLAFSISENNYLGKGINVSANFDISKETATGGLSVTDPNYNFSGNSLSYFISNTKNDKPKSGFKNNIVSTGIGSKFEQYRDVFLYPNLIFSYDDLKVENTASASLKKQKGTFSDLSFDYSIITDKRDRAYGPTNGHIFTFNQTLPLYADAPFVKNSLSLSKYVSLTEDIIAAFKLYGAAISGLNNEDVRLSKRIGLSYNRLRGFENGKIGPKDGEDYIGGNYAAAANFELNLPKLLPDSTNVDVGMFLDLGNVWAVDYDKSIDDSNKLRSSIGINTNWLSPAGPMSFIFSQNISKANTDITESFNFRLGTTF